MENGRYAITLEDNQLALWHFHPGEAEFVGWYPASCPLENLELAKAIHEAKCKHISKRKEQQKQ
jgi:hypothetical protein